MYLENVLCIKKTQRFYTAWVNPNKLLAQIMTGEFDFQI